MDNPNKEIYSQELISIVKGEFNQYPKDINDKYLLKEGLNIADLQIETLSEKDLQEMENIHAEMEALQVPPLLIHPDWMNHPQPQGS